MQRFQWRGPDAPPEHNAFQSSLPEAKYRAWAGVSGELRPAGRQPAPPRRPHPGLLDDLPLPEGPMRPRRTLLGAAVAALSRALRSGGRPAAASQPPASPLPAGGGIISSHADRSRTAEAPASAGMAEGRRAAAA